MKIGREELEDLREGLERLTDFIRNMEQGELPYFYRYFDTMKNNIEIFFWMDGEDIEDFLPVLERDWEASHTTVIGVQNYDIRKEHPDLDPVLCIYSTTEILKSPLYFLGLVCSPSTPCSK